MPSKRKDQTSSWLDTPRRVLESLPIKDFLPSSSQPGECESDQDNNNPCSTFLGQEIWQPAFPWPPQCPAINATAGLHRCRDRNQVLSRESKSKNSLDDCRCSKFERKRSKTKTTGVCKRERKTDSKTCCHKRHAKRKCNKFIMLDDCVCDSGTRFQNRVQRELPTYNKRSFERELEKNFFGIPTNKKRSFEREIGKTFSDKNTCCSTTPSQEYDCACEKEMIKNSKEYCKKVKKEKSCHCHDKLNKKTSNKSTSPTTVKCRCDDKMKKRSKEMCKKIKCADSETFYQKLFKKKTSDKAICCCAPRVGVDSCSCNEIIKKRSKTKLKRPKCADSETCCQELCNEKTSSKESCSCYPSRVVDICDCSEETKKQKTENYEKIKRSDSKISCQKLLRKKTSSKGTSCCLSLKGDDNCISKEEIKKRSKVSLIKVKKSDSRTSCQKLFKKKTKDNETCCCIPTRVVDACDCIMEIKRQNAKKRSSTELNKSCSHRKCPINTCTCRFPPAYAQNFHCIGQLSGTCDCDKNNEK